MPSIVATLETCGAAAAAGREDRARERRLIEESGAPPPIEPREGDSPARGRDVPIVQRLVEKGAEEHLIHGRNARDLRRRRRRGREVARQSVDRSKRAEGRRRSSRAKRKTRPRGAETSQSFSGWLKARLFWNMLSMVVTRETCGGGGAEVARVARASSRRSIEASGGPPSNLARKDPPPRGPRRPTLLVAGQRLWRCGTSDTWS